MNIDLINPFVLSSFSVLRSLLNDTPAKGELSVRPGCSTTHPVSVLCGVTGDVRGQVIFGMSLLTADRVAGAMLGASIMTFDDLAASAIAELANMISGNALILLSEQGYHCDISPPAIVRGSELAISTFQIPAVVIPLAIAGGEIFLTVGLERAGSLSHLNAAA